MLKLFLLICGLFISIFAQTGTNGTECVSGPSVWYNGTRNYTRSEIPCQRWDVTIPHTPNYIPKDGGHYNYCRNPDQDVSGLWCYTTNTSVRWEYCNVPKCPDDATIVWTSRNPINKTSQLLSAPADAEVLRQQASESGRINSTVLANSQRSNSNFWAVTSDYLSNQIFFADYRSKHVGVYNTMKKTTELYLEGMGHGIESMAYDWMTGNFYMSDSTLKWILVSSSNFKYYNYVYKADPNLPYGLTLHAKLRYLYFSTYQYLGSKIIRTDMAGKNATTLLKYPDVHDVTGMTVDYADEKLYWTDATIFESSVMSSDLDGKNKTRLYQRSSSIYWGIASYLNYIYVTDTDSSTTPQGMFAIWSISKLRNQTGVRTHQKYIVNGKPRGITVFSKNVEYSPDEISQIGSCRNASRCDHICLPRINVPRECTCSLGYIKEGDTRCVTKTIQDEFMFISDAGQSKIYQLALTANVSTYVAYPLPMNTTYSYMTVDIKSDSLFWSDKTRLQINQVTLNGSVGKIVASGKHARSLAMESNDGNLYFVDDDTQYISLVNTVNFNVRTIMKPSSNTSNTTDIKQVTLDLQQKFVYWTDTNSADNKGQVWRMRYDGSQKELVFDNLNWPHAITYDPAKRTLFFSEAKELIVYAIPTSRLLTVNGTIPRNVTTFKINSTTLNSYVGNIQVYEELLYFHERLSLSVEVINMTQGVASLRQFSPREFFSIRSLAIWSRRRFREYIDPLRSNCSSDSRNGGCPQICVSMGISANRKCLCKDKFRPLGTSQCVDDGTRNFNVPPSYNNTCPSPFQLVLEPCANSTTVRWNAPTWTDDTTHSSNLSITTPNVNLPLTLKLGTYVFAYSATDAEGAIGHCRFTVSITQTKCLPRPSLSSNFTQTPILCTGGSPVYTISCRNPLKVLHPLGNSSKSFRNRCFSNGNWMVSDLNNISCIASGGRPSSTHSHTTTMATRAKTVTATTTTVVTTTTQTTNPTSRSTTQKLTTTLARTSKTSTGAHTPAIDSTSTLSPGATAAIVILVLILIAVIAAIIVVQIRSNRTSGTVFPVFWKPSEDRITFHDKEITE